RLGKSGGDGNAHTPPPSLAPAPTAKSASGAALVSAATNPATAQHQAATASGRTSKRHGIFDNAADATAAAFKAFEQLREKGVAARRTVVDIVKRLCTEKAVEWGRFEFEETKIGRLDHK